MILTLSRALDELEKQEVEVSELLSDRGRRLRMQNTIFGSSWVNWYEWPTNMTTVCMALALFPIAISQELLDRFGFGRRLAAVGLWNLENAKGERDFIVMPKLMIASWRVAAAQYKSVVVHQATVNELLRRAKRGDDESYFDALTIDPAVLGSKAFLSRLQAAVALEDREFLTRMNTALRSPVSRNSLNKGRLRAALWLLHRAKVLDRLTPKSAYELFVVQTKLYPALGLEDSQRSLWKMIQRFKAEIETKSRKKMSPPTSSGTKNR